MWDLLQTQYLLMVSSRLLCKVRGVALCQQFALRDMSQLLDLLPLFNTSIIRGLILISDILHLIFFSYNNFVAVNYIVLFVRSSITVLTQPTKPAQALLTLRSAADKVQ